MTVSQLLVILAVVPLMSAQQQFTYENYGAENWPLEFPTCGGDLQSPIDVSGAVPADLGPFQFNNYRQPAQATISNNGHTAEVTLNTRTIPTVEGGGLPGLYVFDQLHFHWGSSPNWGSEHTLFGSRFPMEMHMVHYNSKFKSFKEAVASGEPTAVAVLGFFFQATYNWNPYWDNLARALAFVEEPNTEHQVNPPTSLFQWMPPDLSSFYRYYGSLTTPTCDQVVVWTLFETPIPIGLQQLAQWNRLRTTTGSVLTDNFRPMQARNGRQILYNQQWRLTRIKEWAGLIGHVGHDVIGFPSFQSKEVLQVLHSRSRFRIRAAGFRVEASFIFPKKSTEVQAARTLVRHRDGAESGRDEGVSTQIG
ncbi:unnamed protein product [Darwinula stevensoni]|uniref:Carbonic anhydrase n=1 Tax=Darwinula stevensoni TaxID=69355 RepID=A0A7R9A8F8_9CRUS|nr:unnamed protein product [Darwinula stevensoni]CAG0896413.1 unnamed protein product [Darwinula stevensoni]